MNVSSEFGDEGGSPALPRADEPNDEPEEVKRRARIRELMRDAGPREMWPTATCRTCRRQGVYVIRVNGRLHPHEDPHDGLPCHDHNDYTEEIAWPAK